MGSPLSIPSSVLPIEGKGKDTTSSSMNSSRNTSDSSKDNSSGSSDDGGPSQNVNSDAVRQDLLAIPTATSKLAAAVDEPYHVFGNRKKWLVVVQIGVAGTFSGLTSSIYFPCLHSIKKVIEHNFKLPTQQFPFPSP